MNAPGNAIIKRQKPMHKVLLALVPCMAGSVYYFGWRSLVVIVVSCLVAFACEFAFCRKKKEPVSEACFVTAVLFALVMPPTVPWHVVVIGSAFAIVFSKQAFGGFGKNIFNPAISGRCFVYICFPVALTAAWAPAAQGTFGALGSWSTVTGPDVITSASPMGLLKAGEYSGSSSELLSGLFLGRISGTMGVTSALLILIGGIYLFYTKVASRATILSAIIVYALLNQGFYLAGISPVPGALPALLGGGFLFGAFFMATDPVSSPKTQQGKIIYGALIALSTFTIRNFSIFNGGLMFSILIGNMFAPLIDYTVKTYQKSENPERTT